MATIKKKICDRCGKEMVYSGWTAFVHPARRMKITEIFNGNPTGYDYSTDYVELCADCTRSYKRWFKDLSEVEGDHANN